MRRLAKILLVLLALLVMAFVLFRTPDTDVEEMRAKYGGSPSQYVELANGMTVHLRDEGPASGAASAPVLLLLHGSNSDLHTWDKWVDRLKDDYRIIRYDQRGHGLTGPAKDETYLLESFVGDVEAVAQALGLDKFILAGNSMGGWVSTGYALEHPERLNGLVLVDASGPPIENDRPPPIGFRIARTPIIRDIARNFLPRSIFEQSLAQSVANQAVVTDEMVDRYWELARYPGNRDATMLRFRTERRNFTVEDMAKLGVPTLVMWGEQDALVPLAAGEWYAEQLPNAQLVTYPEFGHLPQQENPEESADDLRKWISGLSRGE